MATISRSDVKNLCKTSANEEQGKHGLIPLIHYPTSQIRRINFILRDYVRFNRAQFKTNFYHTIDANGEKIGAVSEDFLETY